MDNPETLTTFVHKTQEEEKQNKNTTQKTEKKDEQHRPDQNPGVNPGARKGYAIPRVPLERSNLIFAVFIHLSCNHKHLQKKPRMQCVMPT